MTHRFDLMDDRDSRDLATALEVLALTQPQFADLTVEEQLRQAASFVLERREELARSPELQRWLAAGLN